MRVPNHKLSSETLLDVYASYLGARLKADPITGAVHSVFLKAKTALDAANTRQRQALSDLQELQSARDYADFVLDELLGEFEAAVFTAAKRDRKNPLYLRIFPKALSVQTRTSPTKQIERVKTIEKDLAEATTPSVLKTWLAKMVDLRAKLEKAIDVWSEARIAHSTAQFAEKEERTRWLRAYQVIHAELVKLFPGNRKKVDSFFRPAPKTTRREESPPADETRLIEPPKAREDESAA